MHSCEYISILSRPYGDREVSPTLSSLIQTFHMRFVHSTVEVILWYCYWKCIFNIHSNKKAMKYTLCEFYSNP